MILVKQGGFSKWILLIQKWHFLTSIKQMNDALKEFSCLVEASCKMIDYSENATYLVEDAQGKKYILRISRPNYHKKEEIEAEIAWLNSLHEQSPIDVSLPVRADDGDYVHAHRYNDTIYYSTLFTFLEGMLLMKIMKKT